MSIKPLLAAALALSMAAPLSLPLAGPAFAADGDGPSFNCARARTWVEKTICRDRALADKDRRLSVAYNSLIDQAVEGGGAGTDVSRFREEQRRWLAQRNKCRTKACIHAAYDKRIGEVTVDY